MTDLQQVQLRVSETKEALNTLLATPEDKREKDYTDKLNEATAEWKRLEAEQRALIILEQQPVTDKAEAVAKPIDKLESRAKLSNYVNAASEGVVLKGAEAELNQEVFGDNGGRVIVPLSLFEKRQAVPATSLPAEVGQSSEDYVGRAFNSPVSQFLGIRQVTANRGDKSYFVLTSGVTGEGVTRGGSASNVAATFETHELTPRRITASYRYRVEDLARSGGLEDSLRNDIVSAINQEKDRLNVMSVANPGGLLADIKASAVADDTAVLDFQRLLKLAGQGIDGLYASQLSDVSLLTGVQSYRLILELFGTAAGGVTAIEWLDKIKGVMAFRHIAPPSTSKNQLAVVARRGTMAESQVNAVSVLWNGVELIRDPYTNAQSGEVHITAVCLWDYATLRKGAYVGAKIKTE